MNTTKIAAALRLLADAIETPTAADATVPAAAAAVAAPPVAAAAVKRGPGRPPSAKPTAAPAAATTLSAATAPPAPSAAPAAASGTLTHAIVANDFKAAALAHGRDFVKGLLTAHGAPTFDKVKDLATFQAQLRAGPQAAPAPTGAADDLLG